MEKKHAVIIDAGSTGSRVLAFSFYKSAVTGELVLHDELWHEVKPGLSSFADSPDKGGETILQLIQIAKGRIPESHWAETPISLKATAGLRLLPAEKAKTLLNTVKSTLLNSGFKIVSGDPGVEIMSDLEEGIFGWVTVNFLLDKLGEPGDSAVALDLGGGSTQISFLPVHVSTLQETPEQFLHIKDISGVETSIYTHSYLGLGLMAARKAILQAARTQNGEYVNPCFKKAESWSFHGEEFSILPHNGADFNTCHQLVSSVLSSKNIHSPSELEARSIVAFSYFYDRAVDSNLIPSSGGQLTLAQYRQAGERWCTDLEASFQCIDLTFIYALLSTYGIKDSTPIGIYKKINGHETSWALGAALDLLSRQ
ncbi:ectonucleoside triphosphate diphosphohydrolase 5 isoform X3 [Eurytemora carolleeae]|nr:ectonucleoside triphosphate diphosphohydrolase 5 isoform X3 [Eurytemora carolleeae]|eukprot:XP_023328506.1 ectonucleoside triphosphate diphosphohydrolase 5-like isoform X3 [Eurytemora affinis]